MTPAELIHIKRLLDDNDLVENIVTLSELIELIKLAERSLTLKSVEEDTLRVEHSSLLSNALKQDDELIELRNEVARITSALAGAFTVKPLRWSDFVNGSVSEPIAGIIYRTWPNEYGGSGWTINQCPMVVAPNMNDAKAACEADWRKRITAALVPAASPERRAE